MTTEKKIVRELGSSERMMNAFHDAETFLLAQAIFIISKEPVTSDLIRGALKRLMVKIPCLKLTIVDRVIQPGKDPKPVYVENHNMRIPFETNEETDWIRQMSREWKKKYDLSEGPLWRAIHLPNVVLNKKNEVFPHETVIIFDFLHTIIDGMSYQRLFGEFLRCLEEVRRGEVADPEPGTVSLPLEHYMESLHKAIKEEKFAVQHQAVDVFLQLLRSTGGSVKGLLPGAYGRNPEPLILTNMGYCNFLDAAPDANFKLVGRFGGHSDHNMGFIFTSNLNTFNGEMCWTVLYSNHIVPVERAVKYATYVRQTILRFTLPDTEL